jgi:hypothetical protein
VRSLPRSSRLHPRQSLADTTSPQSLSTTVVAPPVLLFFLYQVVVFLGRGGREGRGGTDTGEGARRSAELRRAA